MNELDRFIKAQEQDYSIALNEIKNGHKRTHWIWYIFPQLKGLGMSSTSEYYGIDGILEAKEYLENEYLKNNLLEISNTLLSLESNNIKNIVGFPDDLKIKSCMTLFNYIEPNEKVFKKILDKYYNGELDENTINLLKR